MTNLDLVVDYTSIAENKHFEEAFENKVVGYTWSVADYTLLEAYGKNKQVAVAVVVAALAEKVVGLGYTFLVVENSR